MKRIGSAFLVLVFVLSLLSLTVFAEDMREINLPAATVGEYYHQEATIADVLAGTQYAGMASNVKIKDIKVISGEVPLGLKESHTDNSVVFKGTPTEAGKYSFVVEVSAILMGYMPYSLPVKVNIEVKEATIPDDTPPSNYEKPQFVKEPDELYELTKGDTFSVQVSAKCAEKCNFVVYCRVGAENDWEKVKTGSNTNDYTFTCQMNVPAPYDFKIVAYNSMDDSLYAEKMFRVNVSDLPKAPSYAVVEGTIEYGIGTAADLVCEADGTAPVYNWYIQRSTESGFTKIHTGKNLSYVILPADDGAKIKCEVSNSEGIKTSNTVTITVKTPHTHSFGAWETTKNPTCTVAGLETRSCSCGEKETRNVPATGHVSGDNWTTDISATCVNAGSRSMRCSACNEKINEEIIPALGHSFTGWTVVKEATETTEGVETRSCKRCSAIETQTIPKLDGSHTHSFGDWKVEKEVTCTEDGLKSRSCSCGYVQTTTVTSEGHKYSAVYTVVVAPTCTAKGQKAKQCTSCGEYSSKMDIDPTGHSMSAWEVVISPTYESEGLETQKCTNTGCTHRVEKTIAKLISGHTHAFSEWTISVAPTCGEKGTEKRTCSCGAVETNELEAVGHTFGAWIVTLAPTTARDGVETRTCTECPKAERRAVPKLTGDEPSVTPVPTPDATPTVTPDVTPDNTPNNTQIPETNLPQTGSTQEPPVSGGDDGFVFGGDMIGIVILLVILVVLAVVLFMTVKILVKA